MQYLKLFNFMQINEDPLMQLLVFDNNTWKHLTVSKRINDRETN